MDTWDRIVAVREGFLPVAEHLTPQQWDAPSLCRGWRVRDVLAHTVHPERFALLPLLPGLARAGFRPNRFLLKDAIRRGSVPLPELLESYRRAIPHRALPPGAGPGHILADLFVHLQDIRRPLSLGWDHDPALLVQVADVVHAHTARGRRGRAANLRLCATDVPWSAGEGQEVRGPLEALVMVMEGRGVALADVQGPGAARLRSRLVPAAAA